MNSNIKRLLGLALCLMLFAAVLFPVQAGADFGGFSGDSDYGSSGGSSGWDSDDSDYDSSSGFLLGALTGLFGSGGGSLVAVLIVGLILLFIMRNSSKGRAARVPQGAQRTTTQALRPVEAYTLLDPRFDLAAFEEKLSNLYVQMQNGWQDKDIDSLRPYFTDAIFTQMERQLDMLRKAGRTNYIERIAVLGVDVRGFFQSNGEDHMVAELRTRIVDYTLDDASGELLSGDRGSEKFMTYEWELTRASGKTTAVGEEMQHVNCPNCGAPLSINTTAKCPYCDSVVTLEQHDWAISSIKGISQETT